RPSTPSAPAPAPSAGGGSSGGGGASSGSGWVRPSAGYMSSGYGMRVNPVTGVYRMHDGIDLAPGCNSPIYAATSGTVTFAGLTGGYGNYIQVSHGGGVSTAYGHIVNGGIKVSRGQSVVAGQLIALVGSTGNSTGCHLHFETRVGGASTNPVPFMAARGVRL
ncbi:M23 family metallopeptidase, partial [Frigoribacterium sp. CFBP 13605]